MVNWMQMGENNGAASGCLAPRKNQPKGVYKDAAYATYATLSDHIGSTSLNHQ